MTRFQEEFRDFPGYFAFGRRPFEHISFRSDKKRLMGVRPDPVEVVGHNEIEIVLSERGGRAADQFLFLNSRFQFESDDARFRQEFADD